MKTIEVEINDVEFNDLNLSSNHISFEELQKKMAIRQFFFATQKMREAAQENGLSNLSEEEIFELVKEEKKDAALNNHKLMHRVIIDTNVLISHCISPFGYSSKIIEHILVSQNIQWHISPAIFSKYTDVLNRQRFNKKYPNFSATSRLLLASIPKFTVNNEPKKSFNIILDKSDNKFLDLAFAANADFIITGNSLDFTIKEFYNTKIVSPQEYWNNYINYNQQ